MSDQQKQEKEGRPDGNPTEAQGKQSDNRPRRMGDNRRRGGRGRSRSPDEPSTPGEQRQTDDNRSRKDRQPQSHRRQTEGKAPGTSDQAATTSSGSTTRQSRPGSRRRRRRPSQERGQQSERTDTSNAPDGPRTAQGGRSGGPEFQPKNNSAIASSQGNKQSGRSSKGQGRRPPQPEDGQVEAHFIPPEPARDQTKSKASNERTNRGGKPSASIRGSRKSRQPGNERGATSQPSHGSATRRSSGRRASLSRRGSSRVFSPENNKENESSDRESTNGQSTYVSLLGRFTTRPAPSAPIRTNRGIKARSQRGDFSQNWWARRWIKSMEQLVDPARLQRGRSYARSGQVLSVQENPYGVEARVQGSRPTPYKVIIQLTPLTDDQWDLVINALAEQALFTAQLLAGEMPVHIEDAFENAGVSLFPKLAGDLFTSCSCPDWANPCKHVAATHYILADRFDDDPFLLFRMRGRSQEQILSDLNLRRGGEPEAIDSVSEEQPNLIEEQSNLDELFEHFWEPAESLDTFPLTINPPRIDMPLLTRLGEPAFLPNLSLLNILRPVYSRFTYSALRAAYSEDEPVESNPSEPRQEQDHRKEG